jgi:hypothetical protein
LRSLTPHTHIGVCCGDYRSRKGQHECMRQ